MKKQLKCLLLVSLKKKDNKESYEEEYDDDLDDEMVHIDNDEEEETRILSYAERRA